MPIMVKFFYSTSQNYYSEESDDEKSLIAWLFLHLKTLLAHNDEIFSKVDKIFLLSDLIFQIA